MFQREDWTLFRTLNTLGQKAGVAAPLLPKLVAKELADNALDAAGSCEISLIPGGNGFRVEDDGGGIPGDDDAVAGLFSVNRPLTSSKLLRLPSRGAMGNGLRVVAGAVLATGGSLTVATRGRTLRLTPDPETGRTSAARIGGFAGSGSVVEAALGQALTVGLDDLAWADRAVCLQVGDFYPGRTSAHWYDSESFRELLRASGPRTVRDVMEGFDGCSGANVRAVVADFRGRAAKDLDAAEADLLLGEARRFARPVNPSRLGKVGAWVEGFPISYHVVRGGFSLRPANGAHSARLPCVVEAWAQAIEGEPEIEAFVNRTPITAELSLRREAKGKGLGVFGCNLRNYLAENVRGSFRVFLNVTSPHMPITSDGKAPDFRPLLGPIAEAGAKAARRAKSLAAVPTGRRPESLKGVILECLPAAIDKAGGGGRYRFSLRQLFYAVRPYAIKATGREPEYDYFGQIVTGYEAEKGDVPGMYRDPRGTLYHPHEGREIPLGTISVERYSRPEWSFNKILYCEKEGFFPILRETGWPERRDCALLTSKGFASRAARDVIDLIGETDEEIVFYCIHDADAYGTMIYQALQEETKARAARRVRIVNLGLEPAEAIAMNLQVEPVNRKGAAGRTAPVADYVELEWREWLQTKRVELNAMTTPEFLAWLDGKFADAPGKVVPPRDVLADRLKADALGEIKRRITAEVLSRARVDDRAAEALARRAPLLDSLGETIRERVTAELEAEPGECWEGPVGRLASDVAAGRGEAIGAG